MGRGYLWDCTGGGAIVPRLEKLLVSKQQFPSWQASLRYRQPRPHLSFTLFCHVPRP